MKKIKALCMIYILICSVFIASCSNDKNTQSDDSTSTPIEEDVQTATEDDVQPYVKPSIQPTVQDSPKSPLQTPTKPSIQIPVKDDTETPKPPIQSPIEDKPQIPVNPPIQKPVEDKPQIPIIPPIQPPLEDELINTELKKVKLSINDIENKLLDDIVISDIYVSGFDNTKYNCIINIEKDYIKNSLNVSYTLTSILGTTTSQTLYQTFIGFKLNPIPQPPITQLEMIVSTNKLTVDANQSESFTVKLNKKPDTNKTITITSDNPLCEVQPSNITFTPENYNEVKTITVTSKIDSTSLSQTATLTLTTNDAKDVKVSIDLLKGDTLNTEYLEPFASGFIREPLQYYTAYYDVDYHIEKLYYKLNGGSWIEIINDQNGSFTNNACLIELPYSFNNTSPTVKLKAVYKEKVKKTEGIPTFTLEGYKIKATLNGKVEYFTPLATPPTALINSTTDIALPNYKEFTRVNKGGEVEKFYLVLRPKSTSQFTVDGLSPTDFNKIFQVSQDKNKRYYYRLSSYYTKDNNQSSIKFVDRTEKTSQNYKQWRIALEDAIYTFNECLKDFNIHIEEVAEGQSDNSIVYGKVHNDYAGLTIYKPEYKRFTIQVSDNPQMIEGYNNIKAVTLHEMGHLVGFSDSAYAINDSVYSYARDKTQVTYFQPNDIATIKYWLNH